MKAAKITRSILESVRRAERLSKQLQDACADANAWMATYHKGDTATLSRRLREASELTRGLALDLRTQAEQQLNGKTGNL